MTDTVKHMWDEVEKARADGTFSSEHAAVPAQDAAFQEALQDCKTHRDAWRGALLDKQTPFGSDDDGSYWAHELRAFDRTFAALTAPRTPAEVVHPDDFAQFLRDVEREQGNCSDEDTWLGYRQTAEAILEKFDVRPKHSSTMLTPEETK